MPSGVTRLALLLLLAGGCGQSRSWSTSFELPAATAETRLSVTAYRGRVRLRNSTSGRVEVTLRGEAPIPLERALKVSRNEKPPLFGLGIDSAAEGADLDLEIAAPPGISFSCIGADVDIEVSGTWARLDIRSHGAIAVRVDRADRGELTSHSGPVEFVVLGSGPVGDFTAKSTSGDVTVRLPAEWGGQVHFLTQTGKLDVPPHAGFQTKWDEDGKGVVGHVGPPREKGAPLPTVWGTSASGLVSFRMGE